MMGRVFCHFCHKRKKFWDIFILHKCIKNHDHTLYCCGDMACHRCNDFSHVYQKSFFVLYPIKKMNKTPQYIIIFYTSVPKINIICYTVPEIWHVTDVIAIFHLRLFFALLPTRNSSKNQN